MFDFSNYFAGLSKLKISIIIIIFLAAMSIFLFLSHVVLFPITHVSVYGDLTESQQVEVEKLIRPYINSGFFGLQMSQIEDVLTGLPEVSTAEVKRVWPNQLNVLLSNQSITALWNGTQSINCFGEAIQLPKQVDPKTLPQLYGPDDQQLVVLDYYQQFSDALMPLSLSIDAIRLTDDDIWSVRLSNKTVVELGDRDVLNRMMRFVEIYPQLLAQHKMPPHQIDMRYKNGMAVDWK